MKNTYKSHFTFFYFNYIPNFRDTEQLPELVNNPGRARINNEGGTREGGRRGGGEGRGWVRKGALISSV